MLNKHGESYVFRRQEILPTNFRWHNTSSREHFVNRTFRRQHISSKDTYFFSHFFRLHVLFGFPGKPIKQWHIGYGDTGYKGDVEDTGDIEHIRIIRPVYIWRPHPHSALCLLHPHSHSVLCRLHPHPTQSYAIAPSPSSYLSTKICRPSA